MKTLKTELSDADYNRLKTAGTKNYQDTIKNPDYDPEVEGSELMKVNDEQTRDEYLAEVVTATIKGILAGHEVNEASRIAVADKQEEIRKMNFNTTVV